MGSGKCCCYLVVGVIILWALVALQREGMWSQPLDDEEWGSPPSTEDPLGQSAGNATLVTVTFASGVTGRYLKIGFADVGTPAGATYEQYELETKFLQESSGSIQVDKLRVRAGADVIISYKWNRQLWHLTIQAPTPTSPDTTIELQEITARPNTLWFWRVLYWEDGVLKEIPV